MPVEIKLSGFFDKTKRDNAASQAVKKSVREFARYVPEQQIKSKPSGKLYRRRGGKNFRRFHRASARGERPAVDTGKLSKSTKHKMTGTFSGEVETVARSNNFDYASQLENKMGRPIQNAKQDVREAQAILDKNAEREMRKLG
jgi:hypothetical protein